MDMLDAFKINYKQADICALENRKFLEGSRHGIEPPQVLVNDDFISVRNVTFLKKSAIYY